MSAGATGLAPVGRRRRRRAATRARSRILTRVRCAHLLPSAPQLPGRHARPVHGGGRRWGRGERTGLRLLVVVVAKGLGALLCASAREERSAPRVARRRTDECVRAGRSKRPHSRCRSAVQAGLPGCTRPPGDRKRQGQERSALATQNPQTFETPVQSLGARFSRVFQGKQGRLGRRVDGIVVVHVAEHRCARADFEFAGSVGGGVARKPTTRACCLGASASH